MIELSVLFLATTMETKKATYSDQSCRNCWLTRKKKAFLPGDEGTFREILLHHNDSSLQLWREIAKSVTTGTGTESLGDLHCSLAPCHTRTKRFMFIPFLSFCFFKYMERLWQAPY